MVSYSDARYHCNRYLNSRPVCKWWSEYWSANQMVIWIQNYHGSWHLNSKPYDNCTNLRDQNTKLIPNSDPHCIWFIVETKQTAIFVSHWCLIMDRIPNNFFWLNNLPKLVEDALAILWWRHQEGTAHKNKETFNNLNELKEVGIITGF